jgi:hypothetical protein
VAALLVKLFRGGIGGRAHKLAHRQMGLGGLQDHRDAEIGDQRRLLLVQQHIGGLEVQSYFCLPEEELYAATRRVG